MSEERGYHMNTKTGKIERDSIRSVTGKCGCNGQIERNLMCGSVSVNGNYCLDPLGKNCGYLVKESE